MIQVLVPIVLVGLTEAARRYLKCREREHREDAEREMRRARRAAKRAAQRAKRSHVKQLEQRRCRIDETLKDPAVAPEARRRLRELRDRIDAQAQGGAAGPAGATTKHARKR